MEFSTLSMTAQILDNAVLAWGLLACGLAQLSKLFLELLLNRRWRPSVLVETGGMPSSHSALVTATAAGVGWQMGFNQPAFALAVTVAFVVMYDASGVRRAAGFTATRVNQLPDSLWDPSLISRSKSDLVIPDWKCWSAVCLDRSSHS